MFGKELTRTHTPIEGLDVFTLPVHGDKRGWFKENWQREKMLDFGPVQNNMSFNAKAGVTRGLHAEPWDKLVSVATGEVFGAWCDLREGSPTYGQTYTHTIDPSVAVFVPRGVANGFQAQVDGTVYSYLVNDHWYPDAKYYFVNLDMIDWPISLDQAEISDKDRNHPQLADATPVPPTTTLVIGAGGQLGHALRDLLGDSAEYWDRSTLDIGAIDYDTLKGMRNWHQVGTIINAAAYTKVDAAEDEGRADAWAINARGVAILARLATEHHIRLVHVSSDYVFDGTQDIHDEEEAFTPLGVYGQTKAAGDIAAATCPNHLIIRTSWVIGRGRNFVGIMRDLAARGVNPRVVDDQIGRLTTADEIARAIVHLNTLGATGTFNVSCAGDPVSWADIAAEIFKKEGRDPQDITRVSTEEFGAAAPRPQHSTLNLAKLQATGYEPSDWRVVI